MKTLAYLFLLIFASIDSAYGSQSISTDIFSKILTLHEGRAKPLDTYSRLILKEIYGRERFEHLNSNDWLLETLFDPKSSYNRKIFKINNPSAISTLGLESDRKYFSFLEIYNALSSNQEMIRSIVNITDNDLDPNNLYLKELYHRFSVYMGLSRSFSFFFKDFSIDHVNNYSYYELKKINNPNIPQAIKDYFSMIEDDSNLSSIHLFYSKDKDEWRTTWQEVTSNRTDTSKLEIWHQLYLAYVEKDSNLFNEVSENLINKEESIKIQLEITQNKIHFSTWIITLYVFSFFLIFINLLYQKNVFLEYSALTLYTGAIIHFLMVLVRSIILSRPPVTNLYESILFVSFTSVVIGILFYLKTKNNIGIFLSSLLGVILLFLGQGYERSGDNMGMIVAVLDTNFWLATHVLTISIGYGCVLVLSFMGHYFLIQFKNHNKIQNAKLLKNIHITLLFSLFFTVLGTILGGIWADQSWGRFWGWDPKENGALLICLWLLWIAHAKISHHFRELSFAFFIGLSSVVVILAWFGVNLLNVGLHSYGFSNDTAYSIAIFSCLEFIILTFLFLRAKRLNQLN